MNQRQLFLRHVAQTSDMPLMLEIEKAKGVYLYDKDGKSYLDLISGIGVSNVGHCHDRVVAAIKNQCEQYMHLMVYGEYVYQPQIALCKLLTDQLPTELDNVYLVNSGTEATEGALKLAKRFTGRREMIGFRHSYHGSSHGSLSLLGSEYFKRAYRPLLPETRSLVYNEESELQQITEKTACVIAEVVQAESGVNPGEESFLRALRRRCTEVGALLIFDEIQTGFGRTGELFAFQHYDIVPDILLLAKGMGGGMPIGAFVASQEMMAVFQDNPFLGHITTFGGNPVCSAAAQAALEVILEGRLWRDVERKAGLFLERLQHKRIECIRNKGLMMAVQFDNFDTTKQVIDQCIASGLITDWFLFADNCLRIAPPLIITDEQTIWACDVIIDSLNQLDSHSG